MKVTRRSWIGETICLTMASPILLKAHNSRSSYSLADIEKRLQSGKGLEKVTKDDLPTPALILDLDLLEANIRKMTQHAKSSSINLRPHGKTHKCPEIARLQIEAGAVGICTSTIHEAEAQAAAGVKELFITSELVGRNKVERLVRLTRKQPDTLAVVDNALGAEQFEATCKQYNSC